MSPAQSLIGFGFTELEADLYCALLRDAPASGYRLAKLVGKAPANTYQGLASLVRKGAAMVDEGAARAFRPVPPEELLNRLQAEFEQRRRRASARLASIAREPERDGIFQIKDMAALYARATEMIARAEDIILFDLFPLPFAELVDALRSAARRGVRVAGIDYAGAREEGMTMVSPAGPRMIEERWPGSQLTIIADAQEHLVALLSPDRSRVLHGVWSASAYLSCLQHNGLASEIRLLDAFPGDGDRLQELSLLHAMPPGVRSILHAVEPSVQRISEPC